MGFEPASLHAGTMLPVLLGFQLTYSPCRLPALPRSLERYPPYIKGLLHICCRHVCKLIYVNIYMQIFITTDTSTFGSIFLKNSDIHGGNVYCGLCSDLGRRGIALALTYLCKSMRIEFEYWDKGRHKLCLLEEVGWEGQGRGFLSYPLGF